MAAYSEKDARDAKQIILQLLQPEHQAIRVEGVLVVSDLELDAIEFMEEQSLLEELDSDAPAVRSNGSELIPASL